MGFGQILFLLGVAVVVGPILIHLLIRPRFKRVPFTMIAFLEVSQQQSRATRRLREWLILLMRCAIVTLLACMFALPFITLQGQAVDRPGHHFIVVDNSLSMTYQDQGRSLLDRAIEKAVQYVEAHREGNALFDIYTGCGGHLGSRLTAPAAIDTLRRIAPAAHKAEMTDVSVAAGAAIDEHEDTSVYLVSDFTPAVMEALVPWQSIKGLQDVRYDIVAALMPANALVKDARVLRYQGGIVELLVEVENSGHVAQRRLLSASVRNENVEVTAEPVAVDLAPARSSEYVLKFDPGDQLVGQDFLPVEISLGPPDALSADDTYFLGVQIEPSPQQRVLIAGRSPEQGFLIQEALEAISRADFDDNLIVRTNQGPTLDRARLGNSDILICGYIGADFGQDVEALDRFLSRGGTAVFFVSREMSLSEAQRLYREGIIGAEPFELIDERHVLSGVWPADGVFASAGLDVDTARATRHYTLDHLPLWSHFACRQRPESTTLWPIETGHYLLYTRARGAGKTLLVNTSIDDTMSALTKRPVVIPLCRLILGSGAAAHGYGFHVEEQVTLPVFESEGGSNPVDRDVWVLDPSGDRHHVLVAGSSLTGQFPDQTGWLQTLSDPVRYVGVNVATGETDLHTAESTEIDRCLASLSGSKGESSPAGLAAASVDSNRSLWKLLAWIVIGLLLMEAVVVNRVKR